MTKLGLWSLVALAVLVANIDARASEYPSFSSIRSYFTFSTCVEGSVVARLTTNVMGGGSSPHRVEPAT